MKLLVRNHACGFVELHADRAEVIAVLVAKQRLRAVTVKPSGRGLTRLEHVVDQQHALLALEQMM